MEKRYKVVMGIKLYPRTCTECGKMDFWVPASSKQTTCGMFCEQAKRKSTKGFLKRCGDFTDKVKRSDYEDE
jgi:hypothetical protein